MDNRSPNFAPDNIPQPPVATLFVVRNVVRFLEMTGALMLASQSELMTLQDAATYRDVSPECLGQMIKNGSLACAPIYSGGRKKPVVVLVRKSDIDALPPVKHPNARKFRVKGK